MLQPVRTKYRKAFKGRIHGNASRAVKLNYGQFGLKNTNPHIFIFNKHLFKIKLFLKKTVRRSNITNRYL